MEREKLRCDYCKKEYYKKFYNQERPKNNFCCRECHRQWKIKNSIRDCIGEVYGELKVVKAWYDEYYRKIKVKCECLKCGVGERECMLQQLKANLTTVCRGCARSSHAKKMQAFHASKKGK